MIQSDDTINEVFNKEFTLKRKNTEEITDLIGMSADYEIKFMELEHILFDCLNKLENINLKEWSMHTKRTDMTSSLSNFITQNYAAELCTRAWLKFYEILYRFKNEIFQNYENLNSVHLCEAPGAFISALNHFISTYLKTFQYKWSWSATSLNSDYEGNPSSIMISDDIFIKSTRSHWYFGEDNSGDILVESNFQSMIKYFKKLKPNLITADGGVDCSLEPENQESITYKIIESEILISLNILEIGGNFILKIFNYFSKPMRNLIYKTCQLFDQVKIFKPSTSSHGNCEKYLIFICYNRNEDILISFKEFNNNYHDNMWLDKFYNSARYFCDFQIKSIETNIYLLHFPIKSFQNISLENQNRFIEQYTMRYNIKKLYFKNKLLIDHDYSIDNLKISYNSFNCGNNYIFFECMDFNKFIFKINPIFCRSYKYITFSRFIPTRLLVRINKIKLSIIEKNKKNFDFVQYIRQNRLKSSIFKTIFKRLKSYRKISHIIDGKVIYIFISKTCDEKNITNAFHILFPTSNPHIIYSFSESINSSSDYFFYFIHENIFDLIRYESEYRHNLVDLLVYFSINLNIGGSIMFLAENLLSNFMIDYLVYISCCFSQIYISKINNDNTVPFGFFIFAHNFLGVSFETNLALRKCQESVYQFKEHKLIHRFCEQNVVNRCISEEIKKFNKELFHYI